MKLILIPELFFEISTHLSDKEKINLIICNKSTFHNKNIVIFNDFYNHDSVYGQWAFNQVRNIGSFKIFPFSQLKSLSVEESMTIDNLKRAYLPSNIQHLVMPYAGYSIKDNFSQCPTLTHLTINYCCGEIKDCFFPFPFPSIKQLVLGEFNKNLDYFSIDLMHSLTHLALGEIFNQSIDNLPHTLTHLTLGEKFNQSIDNLPSTLTHLILGEKFNQSINNLPSTLTHLILGENLINQLTIFLIH